MIRITDPHFDIKKICDSGQCFRMDDLGQGAYALTARGKYLRIRQTGGEVRLYCSQTAFDSTWMDYFDLKQDYQSVYERIDIQDKYLLQAAGFGKGIRILRQDLWEMIITFIISQQNNIKRIRRCIRLLCERYGKMKKGPGGLIYFDFPSVQALAGAEEKDLRECNLGYRSRYLIQTAQSIKSREVKLTDLQFMDYENARQELMKLSGVGAKVADCICLFALQKMDAFPVDTHISQVLDKHYPDGFPFDKYQGISGILQQYIFYYDLMNEKFHLQTKDY